MSVTSEDFSCFSVAIGSLSVYHILLAYAITRVGAYQPDWELSFRSPVRLLSRQSPTAAREPVSRGGTSGEQQC